MAKWGQIDYPYPSSLSLLQKLHARTLWEHRIEAERLPMPAGLKTSTSYFSGLQSFLCFTSPVWSASPAGNHRCSTTPGQQNLDQIFKGIPGQTFEYSAPRSGPEFQKYFKPGSCFHDVSKNLHAPFVHSTTCLHTGWDLWLRVA